MNLNNPPIRWDLIAKAQAKIASGGYDALLGDIADHVLCKTDQASLAAELDQVQLGDGHRYRDNVAASLARIFADSIDATMMRKEFPCHGARGDLELPFTVSAVKSQALLAHWYSRFECVGLRVETKNEQKKAGVEDARQLKDYLDCSTLGKVGLLVSRSGFKCTVIRRLAEYLKQKQCLILPVTHEELLRVLTVDQVEMERFFFRKELVLRQAA